MKTLPPPPRKAQPLAVAGMLPVAGIFLLLFVLLSACQKADFSPDVKAEQLDVATAKEWWYGSFRKSAAYKAVNTQSVLYKMNHAPAALAEPNQTANANAYFPSWKNAHTYHGTAFDYIDVPLVAKKSVLPIPLVAGETHQDRIRIASASMQRLMIVRKNDGNTIVRVATIMPSLAYLKKHHYQLPFTNIAGLPANFEGIVAVRQWDETPVVAWLMKDGKRKQIAIKEKPEIAVAPNRTIAVPCPPVYEIVDYHYYCIDVESTEDEPSDYCDDPNNWQQGNPIYDWVDPGGTCDDGSGPEDYCQGLTTEQCICVTMGIGCEGGGGSGSFDETILLDLENPCITSVYNIMQGGNGNAKSRLLSFVNSYFSDNDVINLRIQDGYHFSDSSIYGRWETNINYPLSYYINLDTKLSNTSKEFRALVMLHEMYHGYLYVKGFDVNNNYNHSLFMTLRSHLANEVKLLFPNLSQTDADALSWFGLHETIPYMNKSPGEKYVIDSIIRRYRIPTNANKSGDWSCN